MKNIYKEVPLDRLTFNARRVLRFASIIASENILLSKKKIGARNILQASILLGDTLIFDVLQDVFQENPELRDELYKILFSNENNLNKLLRKARTLKLSLVRNVNLDESGEKALQEAFEIASTFGLVYVGSEHLFLGSLINIDVEIKDWLNEKGLTFEYFLSKVLAKAVYPLNLISKPSPDAAISGRPTQEILDIFTLNLNKLETGRMSFVSREEEIRQLEQMLLRKYKNNVLITGDSGVGKTALVLELVKRIKAGNVPLGLRNKDVYLLNLSTLLANVRSRGDIEKFMLDVISSLLESKNSILVLDLLDKNLLVGSGIASDLFLALSHVLFNEDLRVIMVVDTGIYTSILESQKTILRRFNVLTLKELSQEDSVIALMKFADFLTRKYNVLFDKNVFESVVRLSKRYVANSVLPETAFDVLDMAASRKSLEIEAVDVEKVRKILLKRSQLDIEKKFAVQENRMEEAIEIINKEKRLDRTWRRLLKKRKELMQDKNFVVNEAVIRQVISEKTGIPIYTINTTGSKSIKTLADRLSKKIIGQKEAVESVALAIKRAKTEIRSFDRPWASFLFLGPTGVGKTELAKVLAKDLFGSGENLIQIDMSEMMEQISVSKLIGSPPGYVGYNEGGQLTEAVKKRPHSVILFDEIEKAHPDVLNLLLQILEYGRLTDGKGVLVDFTNTVIIMTSNIGAEDIRTDKVLGFRPSSSDENEDEKDYNSAYEAMKVVLMKELRNTLKPELLNRIDEVVIFRTLTINNIKKILDVMLEELNERLAEKKLQVSITPELKAYLAKEGFNEEYGARPLRRVLQRYVEGALADYILDHPSVMRGTRRARLLIDLGKENKPIVKRL